MHVARRRRLASALLCGGVGMCARVRVFVCVRVCAWWAWG